MQRETNPDTDTTKLWPAYDAATGRWGFINAKGVFDIEPAFTEVTGFSCGYARVWFHTYVPMFIDKRGKTRVSAYDYADDFYYKTALIESGELYGFMNTSFDNIFQPVFHDLERLSRDGLAAVQVYEDGAYGYVNRDGEMKIPATYDEAAPFEGGVAVVRMQGKYGVINKKNTLVVPFADTPMETIGEGLVAFRGEDGKVGAYNEDGKIVIQPIYDEIGCCFDNDLVPVCYEGKYGYLSKKGDLKIAMKYEYASPFYDGYAVVEKDGRQQFIDAQENLKIRLKDTQVAVTLFHNGLALVCTVGEDNGYTPTLTYDYINTKGASVASWTNRYYDDWWKPAKKPMLQTSRELIEMTQHFDSRKL